MLPNSTTQRPLKALAKQATYSVAFSFLGCLLLGMVLAPLEHGSLIVFIKKFPAWGGCIMP